MASGKLKFKVPAFTDNTAGKCGPIFYSGTLNNGEDLPAFISINSITRVVVVQTGNSSAVGIYQVMIFGALGDTISSLNFQLSVVTGKPKAENTTTASASY